MKKLLLPTFHQTQHLKMKQILIIASLILLNALCILGQSKSAMQKTEPPRRGVMFVQGSIPYNFPENQTEFKVRFPDKPKIKEMFTADSSYIQAEFLLKDGFLRAEYALLTEAQAIALNTIDSKSLSKGAFAHAEASGLSNYTVSVEQTNKARVVTSKGYKVIEGIMVTYETVFYYGKSSCLMLMVAAPSTRFPTSDISKFLDSVFRPSDEKTVYAQGGADEIPPLVSKPKPKTISGGVMNSKAKKLVKPAYPEAALAVCAEGAVNVQITIDESGNVISATATAGHPLLRDVSVKAARSSMFSPGLLDGTPVKVTGVVVYNFTSNCEK